MIALSNGAAIAVVDPARGGRLISLGIDGTEVLVGERSDPLEWGCYPMVPFAGRIRHARLRVDGREHVLEARAGSHALHGTVDTAPWEVWSADAVSLALGCDLGPAWPFRGTVRHDISLSADAIRLTLALTAVDPMPAQVGWHPWFLRPAGVTADFRLWLPRDGESMPGAPTHEGLPPLDSEVDDCFVSTGHPVRVSTAGVDLVLESDCSHWVVYTGAGHGVCVEPQSGPPNEAESAPRILGEGETLSRSFTIRWAGPTAS